MAKQKVKLPRKRKAAPTSIGEAPTSIDPFGPAPKARTAKRKAKPARKLKSVAPAEATAATSDRPKPKTRPSAAKAKAPGKTRAPGKKAVRRDGPVGAGPPGRGPKQKAKSPGKRILSAVMAAAVPILGEIGRLERLERAVRDVRAGALPSPRTRKLLASGLPKMAQKVIEEAAEVAIEAIQGDRAALIHESVDLFYNLLALWSGAGVAVADVWAEMDRREATLGLAEKLPKGSDDDA